MYISLSNESVQAGTGPLKANSELRKFSRLSLWHGRNAPWLDWQKSAIFRRVLVAVRFYLSNTFNGLDVNKFKTKSIVLLFIPFRNRSYTTIGLGIRCPRYWIRFLCSLVPIRSIDMEPVAYVKVECYVVDNVVPRNGFLAVTSIRWFWLNWSKRLWTKNSLRDLSSFESF